MLEHEKEQPPAGGPGAHAAQEDRRGTDSATIPPEAAPAKREPLSPDADAIREALTFLHGDGPYPLTAIPEGKKPKGGVFDSLEAAVDWAVDRNERLGWNVYVCLADPRLGWRGVKAKKVDVGSVRFLWTDIDPDKKLPYAEERPRIEHLVGDGWPDDVPRPSMLIDSGGGFWAIWRLTGAEVMPDNPSDKNPAWVEARLRVEDRNRWLEDRFGADDCHNMERIGRLPGTVNWPNADKRATGRGPALARTVFAGPEVFDAADFAVMSKPVRDERRAKAKGKKPAPAAPVTAAPVTDEPERGIRADDPRLNLLPAWAKKLILVGRAGAPEFVERYESRSQAVCAAAGALNRVDLPDAARLGMLLNPDFGISVSLLGKPGGGLRDARKVLEDTRAAPRAGSAGSTRPRIVYDETELPRMLDEAEAALLSAGVPIYQMSGRLVAAVRLDAAEDDDGVKRRAGALLIRDVNDLRIREHMIGAATFVELRTTKDGEVMEAKKAPPQSFAKHYAAREGFWRLPVLLGVSEVPTLRPDGSVLAASGYDRASRLILDTRGAEFPPVPEEPGRDEAVAAMALLKGVISGFPFVDAASESVALSAILTAVSRRAYRTAPLHGFSAPTMGTGKSLLADVVAMIATGRDATVMTQGKTEEEDEKRLLSVLMQGDPMLVIDNVLRPVEGDALCSILTSETWQTRKLGVSAMVKVSTAVLIVANGNNLEFRGDMSTRAILCTMDARVERPETRRFDVDLREEVPRRQGELVAAALTVLRAFVVAGKPGASALSKFGRFEEWSELVRGALVWVGEADPVDTRELIAVGDSAAEELTGLIDAWEDAVGVGVAVTSARLVEIADPHDAQNRGDEQRRAAADLLTALDAACPRKVSPKAVGKYLAGVKGKIVGGLRIVAVASDHKSATTWRLEEVAK